jgi:catalase
MIMDKGAKGKTHAAPLTDNKAVCPHLNDLAPSDVNTRPRPEPTPPGQEPMAAGSEKQPENATTKSKLLDAHRADGEHQALTTNFGAKVANNQNTLKAGSRGPSLMEDFMMREKLMHFGRERIPERVVHARASAAHGYFQVYKPLAQYTKAAFLQDPSVKTPAFVRLSTVQGGRGSPDTVRDIRGFATKFYTSEGNYDLVGNDTPVFFIQDAVKFPDFVHAVKPEPHNDVPQGQSAHDSFWDFVSLQPEALHNVMWAMSDRGIPRSLRMVEGFGIHTYRLINEQGQSHFVRFHWKPTAGACSLVWDEAQLLNGRDPDFHRKDLWQAIEAGHYPEWELGLQIIPEEDEFKFDFDILDPTKLIPEALVPVKIVGKMTLNRNPDNFFAEAEQVAFCPANIVPGIDFSDDPLLQGRIFSYTDTQHYRLGGPNFNEIPINRPVCPYANHQRDGQHRMDINRGANYEPNSISNNWPRETAVASSGGGFESYPSRVDAQKVRERSESFGDYFSHPRLFWLSQTPVEQRHIINGFSFELGKVARTYIRERIVDLLSHVDPTLAQGVAENLGIPLSDEQRHRPLPKPVNGLEKDHALSLYCEKSFPVASRKVALLIADGVCGTSVETIRRALTKHGVYSMLLAPTMADVKTREGDALTVDGTIEGNPSVLVDAVIVPTGNENIDALSQDGLAQSHLLQAFKHLKVIGLQGDAEKMLVVTSLDQLKDEGVITEEDADALTERFIEAMAKHRIWTREPKIKGVAA